LQVLGALVMTGALSMTTAAYQQQLQAGRGGQPAARVVEVEKVKDNLFVLRGAGGGGNTAVFVMANGVAVVDTKNPGWGQPILDKIKELTPKPVTLIVNTHTHGDHVSGNVEFPASVDIVTHANTAALMKQMNPVTGLQAPLKPGEKPQPTIFERNEGRGLPKRTFTDRMTIGAGADQIDLHYFGRGHTSGDAWVLFPALRVVHAGDLFAWTNQLPILDAGNGGSGVELPDTLMKAHAALGKSADTIITGHTTQMTFDDMRKWADFNREFVRQVQAAKKAGQTVEQFAQSWKAPATFQQPANEQAAAAAMKRLVANVQTIMAETK
jgi:glyoxylase-like metal-dependent hydrolase (beta-lactamase superfamily II)